jgi:hypothetical protein
MANVFEAVDAIDNDLLTLTTSDELTSRIDFHYRDERSIYFELKRFDDIIRISCELGLEPQHDHPATKYGRAALMMLTSPAHGEMKTLKGFDIGFCREAEPRLLQSLSIAGHEAPEAVSDRPAIIVTNAKKRPLGFIKQTGEPTFYTWRNVRIPNAEQGETWLPAGSFSYLELSDDVGYDPEAPIQSVTASDATVNRVRFGRHDMTHYPNIIRRSLTRKLFSIGGHKQRDSLSPYATQTVEYKPSTIAAAVRQLLPHAEKIT